MAVMPRGETKHLKPHQFKKGKPSANPEGGRLHNPITKALNRLTIDTYREVIELVLTGNLQKLRDMITNPETPAIQVGVANSFMKAIKNGDYHVIERIAERIVGKIPEIVNVTTTNTTNITAAIAQVTDDELKKRLDKLRSEL